MTRTTTARIAGLTCLVYMVAGAVNQVVIRRATGSGGPEATLARIGGHATDVRVSILLTLVECFAALVLAVTLYAITRDEDRELALLALLCRGAEGVIGTLGIPNDLALLWLAQGPAGAGVPDAATSHALAAFLLVPGGPVGAVFFAVGNALFAYLLLRGRTVPAGLAGLGVASSALLVIGLPLQVAGFFTGPLTGIQWIPAMLFTLALGLWLLFRGVAAPRRDAPPRAA